MFIIAVYVDAMYKEATVQTIRQTMAYYVCNIRKSIRREENIEQSLGASQNYHLLTAEVQQAGVTLDNDLPTSNIEYI